MHLDTQVTLKMILKSHDTKTLIWGTYNEASRMSPKNHIAWRALVLDQKRLSALFFRNALLTIFCSASRAWPYIIPLWWNTLFLCCLFTQSSVLKSTQNAYLSQSYYCVIWHRVLCCIRHILTNIVFCILQKYYKCANLVLASCNLERSVDRQQKLEKVMDEEGLPDEEVTNTLKTWSHQQH